MTRYTEGFSHFVISMTAPVASGWSDGRVGLAPTGKAPPYHGAHPQETLVASNMGRGKQVNFASMHASGREPLCNQPAGKQILYGLNASVAMVSFVIGPAFALRLGFRR